MAQLRKYATAASDRARSSVTADAAELLASGSAILCLLHCFPLPLAIVALPLLVGTATLSEDLHFGLLALALPTSMTAMLLGWLRHRHAGPPSWAWRVCACLSSAYGRISRRWWNCWRRSPEVCFFFARISRTRDCAVTSAIPSEPRRRAYQLADDILVFRTALGPLGGLRDGSTPSRVRTADHPAMVYRSLSRLIAAERVIRVESLKVFMVVPNVPAVALICSACRSVALLPCPTMLKPLRRHAQARRFAIDRLAVELLGLCSKCRVGQHSDENSDRDRGFDFRPPSELLDTV
jgi:hypothetical protein